MICLRPTVFPKATMFAIVPSILFIKFTRHDKNTIFLSKSCTTRTGQLPDVYYMCMCVGIVSPCMLESSSLFSPECASRISQDQNLLFTVPGILQAQQGCKGGQKRPFLRDMTGDVKVMYVSCTQPEQVQITEQHPIRW